MWKLLLVLATLFVGAFSGSWTVVDSNYETIAMACDFQTATSGWVAGGSSSAQPLLLHTTDGGKTFNNSGIADSAQGALLAIDMADAGHGVAAGMGFAGVLPCGAYTKDGTTWHVIHEGTVNLVCTSQDVVAIDDGNIAVIGQWATFLDPNGDGMQFSVNGGANFSARDWKQGTPARYGSCLSKDNCFVTGGIWPNVSSTSNSHITGARDISRYLHFNGERVVLNKEKMVAKSQANDGYQAIIAQATNEGKDWKTVLNMTNQGIYFNDISCTDEQHCWVAGEGTGSNGAPTAWLYHSDDAGKTWKLQLTIPSGSLIAVEMLSPTFGWAGGALITSGLTGQFYQTTDGTNWKMVQEIKDFYPSSLSIIDENNAYAAGITIFGLSSLARYS